MRIVLLAMALAAAALASPAFAQDGRNVLKIVYGDDQALPRDQEGLVEGEAVFEPLIVELTDASGAPLAGRAIVFTCQPVPAEMACSIVANKGDTETRLTGGDGRAMLESYGKSVHAYYGTGRLTVTAVADYADPQVFDLVVLPDPPLPPPKAGARLSRVSGAFQTEPLAAHGKAHFAPLRARLVGADGAPLANETVIWSCPTPRNTCAPDLSTTNWTTRTDGDGLVWIQIVAYEEGPLSATASYGGSQAVFPLMVGTPDPRLRVLDTASYADLYLDLKTRFGDDGFALQRHWLTDGLNECRRSSATFSIRDYIERYPDLKQRFAADCPGALEHWFKFGEAEGRSPAPLPPPVVTVVSGDAQTAAREPGPSRPYRAYFAPLAVSVTDAAGKPMAGMEVAWRCGSPRIACQMEYGGRVPTITRTDASGRAVLDRFDGHSLMAWDDDGPLSVTASAGNGMALFTLLVATPPPTQTLRIVAGDGQQAGIVPGAMPNGGSATFGPVSVAVYDAAGKPVAGEEVRFWCEPAAIYCQLTPQGSQELVAVSGADGIATLSAADPAGRPVSLLVYGATGAKVVLRAKTPGSAPVDFNLQALGNGGRKARGGRDRRGRKPAPARRLTRPD